MEGWPTDRFLSISEDSICSICREIPRNAMSISCGHTFCNYCINRAATPSNKCPTCRESITVIVPNYSLRTMIMKSLVTCMNKEYGCSMVQPLEEITVHEKQCTYCHNPCSTCNELVRITEQTIHNKNACVYRFEPCPKGCTKMVRVKDMETHDNEICPETIIACDYCDWKGKRGEKHHDTCEQYIIPCIYKSYGCLFQCSRNTMYLHEKEDHTKILCNAIDTTRKEFNEFKISHLHEGPFKISGHPHRVVLCSDIVNECCDYCEQVIEPVHNNMYFAYRCGKGCPLTICITCLSKKRLYKSKYMLQYPSTVLFL